MRPDVQHEKRGRTQAPKRRSHATCGMVAGPYPCRQPDSSLTRTYDQRLAQRKVTVSADNVRHSRTELYDGRNRPIRTPVGRTKWVPKLRTMYTSSPTRASAPSRRTHRRSIICPSASARPRSRTPMLVELNNTTNTEHAHRTGRQAPVRDKSMHARQQADCGALKVIPCARRRMRTARCPRSCTTVGL